MPPKARYSKEEITGKAMEIIRSQGIEKLTARELAAALETSVRPIFTAFENMEDLKKECFVKSMEVYHSFFSRPELKAENIFKTTGMVYICFAREETELFNYVFLKSQDNPSDFVTYMKALDDCYEDTLSMLQETYGLGKEKSEEFYKHMWLYVNGIATLCATKQCAFTKEEIGDMLDLSCTAFINELKK